VEEWQRVGFSECLSATALTQAIDMGSMYIARNHAIQVPFQLQTCKKRADRKALLDSRATECFVHPQMVQQLGLKTKNLQKPRKVHNIDGTANKAGEIQQACEMAIHYQGRKSKHNFFLADIGTDDIILGYPFFEDLSPDVNWKQGRVNGSVGLETEDANLWKPSSRRQTKRKRGIPFWICTLPDWEEGNEVWQQLTIRKSTVAQQLAIQAVDKMKKPWQEIVPPQYHKYKIWSKEASK
jgi:hypothetical protein